MLALVEQKANLAPPIRANWRRARIIGPVIRLATFVLLAFLVGAVLTRVAAGVNNQSSPAGFGRGMLQGALMPMALPNLLVGRDVPIYAENNAGLRYKLGYTAGVNLCGALFFGFLFFRIQRLRDYRKAGVANLKLRP
jgi:hypothetical protein